VTAYTEMAVKMLEHALELVKMSDSTTEAERRIQKAINNIKEDD
jgi:hypothetical protein